ncbi:MAG TPA: ATP-binding protein, partial [Longimicrobiales bacterium]|nr:ATP-binding protein [Longimicrobiales bacterium]
MEVVSAVIAAVVFGTLGFFTGVGRGRTAGAEQGRSEAEGRIRSLTEALRAGRVPPRAAAGTAEAELQAALESAWAPRDMERQAALLEAVGRVSVFLHRNVRESLSDLSEESDVLKLRDHIGRALGALEDLDFFVRTSSEAREGTDLVALAQRVAREFVADQDVGVRLAMGESAIRASVGPVALMDALYLVLHNAARFGGGATVDLAVTRDDGHAKIVVRDHGPGFTEEAFRRAFDPFYSTSDAGLGLGLPHARKVIESLGGRIELRNLPDGGAEVEMSL